MRISVVGLGKLGAPLLAVLASKGHDMIGIDTDPGVVDKINNHIAPFEEPHLQNLLTENKSRIAATTNWHRAIAETAITMIIVPTPSGADGTFRNDYVLSAIDEIGRVLAHKSDYHLVVVNSTTMPGSVGGPIQRRLEMISGRKVGANLGLCYNPEFIALGEVVEGLLQPDFILIGEGDGKAGDLLETLYRQVVGPQANIARMNFINAELTKISVNTYVTMKISFANMLGEICDRLEGADAAVVADALGRDSRIGAKYLKPAVGYGGPCFPRDTIAFGRAADLVGGAADLAMATDRINARQIRRLGELVGALVPTGARVAILGLAYKPNTPVLEQSQGLMLAQFLRDRRFVVIAHDPMAGARGQAILGEQCQVVQTARQALQKSDIAVIATPWPEYSAIRPDWIVGGTRLIIDCWRQLDPKAFAGACTVLHIGRHTVLATERQQLAAE